VSSGTHPRHQLDAVIHSPLRLSIVAALTGVDRADFQALRDAIETSDSSLSKQLAVLEQAGYVKVTKDRIGRKPRTWLALSPTGRNALEGHLAALAAITDQSVHTG